MAEKRFQRRAVPEAGVRSVVTMEQLGDLPSHQIDAITPSDRELSDTVKTSEKLPARRGRPPKSAEFLQGEVMNLRMSESLMQAIDEARSASLLKPSRNAWILQAVAEKLERSS
jgi:hypothetical protein